MLTLGSNPPPLFWKQFTFRFFVEPFPYKAFDLFTQRNPFHLRMTMTAWAAGPVESQKIFGAQWSQQCFVVQHKYCISNFKVILH